MKVVGLRIEKGRVAASVVERGMRQDVLKDSFSQTFATDIELVDILKDKARDWPGARIISSMPGHLFSQRTVMLPFSDRKRIEKALPFEVEDTVPFSLDDVELDHLVFEQPEKGSDKTKQTTVLGVMVPKTALRLHLDLLASAGVDPQVIVPSFIGLHRIATMVPVKGTAVIVHGSDLCLQADGRMKVCRSFDSSRSTGGFKHTLKALETEQSLEIEKVYLFAPDEHLQKELAELGLAAEQVAPDLNGMKSADPVSLGLALSEHVNLRKGSFAYRHADAGRRNRFRTLIVAGALAALLAGANIGLKYYLVQSGYGKLDREIKDLYRQAIPDARAVADPVRQLRSHLDEAKKKFGVLGSGSSALDVMKAVTEGIPAEVRVNFNDFLLEGDRLKLAGEAASFESVDKIKAELQKSPLFTDVAVQDTRMGVDSKVKFRVEVKLKQTL